MIGMTQNPLNERFDDDDWKPATAEGSRFAPKAPRNKIEWIIALILFGVVVLIWSIGFILSRWG